MSTALQIDRMSLAEKLETMETLWDDLAHHVQDVSMPEWHVEVLAAREADLAAGNACFDDWDSAKESIRRSVK